ncbi:MAG: hypothetical protein HC868_04730 [Sphingomonadales bacterium]|nr:hypothetical protein [Sphingomonadales bacterium]
MRASEGYMRPSHHVMPILIVLLPLDARLAAAVAIGNLVSTAILHRAGCALTGPIHDPADGDPWRWCFTRTAGQA